MYLFQEREDASGVDCAGCDVARIARKGATAILMDATTVGFVVGRLLLLLLLLLLPSCRAQVLRSRSSVAAQAAARHAAPGYRAELGFFARLCAELARAQGQLDWVQLVLLHA